MIKHVIANRDCIIWGLAHLRDEVRRMCLSLYVKQSIIAILGIVLVLCHPSPLAGEEKVRGDFFKGYTLMQEGRYDKAIEEFRKVIEEADPTHGPSYSNLALCYERLERYDDAIEIWERYKGLSPLYEDRIKNHINMVQEMKRIKGTFTNVIASPPQADVAISQVESGLPSKDAIPILESITKDTYPGSGIRLHALRLLGSHYFTNKQYKETIDAYDRLVRDYPKDELREEPLFEYAQSLSNEKEFNKAIQVYEKLKKNNSNIDLEDDILCGIGVCFLNLANYEKSTEIFESFIEKYPESTLMREVITGLGLSSINSGDVSKGIKIFTKFYQENPKNRYVPDALYQSGYCYQTQERYEEAKGYYQQVITKYSDSDLIDDTQYQTGFIYYRQGRYAQAIETFQKIIKGYPNSDKFPNTSYYLIENQFNQIASGQSKNADSPSYNDLIKEAKEIITNYHGSEIASSAQYLIVRCYHEQGDYFNRDKAFEEYIEIGANYYNKKEVAKIAKDMAEGYYKASRYIEAMKLYRLILNKFPRSKLIDDVQFMLGKCYEGIGNYNQALLYYNYLLRKLLEGNQGPLLEAIAGIYFKQGNKKKALTGYEKAAEIYRKTKQNDKAIDVYQIILTHYPGSEEAKKSLLLLALSYLGNRENDKAISQLEKLVRDYPRHEYADRAQFLKGYCYLAQQKYEEAIIAYQKLVRNYPKSPYAKQAEQFVERLTPVVNKESEDKSLKKGKTN